MQIGLLGETDWFHFQIDRSAPIHPSLDEALRQQQLYEIGAALDQDRLPAILADPASNQAFRDLIVRYVSTFLGFRLARRRGLHYMIAFFRARHGSYHARTICLTSADVDHSTLVGGIVGSLHLFRKDAHHYHDGSLIQTFMRDIPPQLDR